MHGCKINIIVVKVNRLYCPVAFCNNTLCTTWAVFFPLNNLQNITDLKAKLTSQIGNGTQKFTAQEENRAK